MRRTIHWYDYITINIYWFALTTRSQVLAPLIAPLLVQRFVGEADKGTYIGIIRLWSLMVAVLVQALMGMLSDRSMSRWGRRRPFILAGTAGELVVFALIGFVAGMESLTGFWALFAVYILSMVFSNTAQSGTQGLIPDLVPDDKKGRFSGVKALFELPLPLIFVSFVMGKLISAGNLWGALFVLMAVLVICALVVMFVREQPLQEAPGGVVWEPFLRLLLMTVVFTTIILVMGAAVNQIMGVTLNLSQYASIVLTGLVGLAGMGFAIGFGVWSSIRISIGPAIREHSSFTWWVVNRLTFLVAATNLGVFMLFYLQERFDEFQGQSAAGPAATVIMFVGVFVLLLALPGGWLADRFGKKPLVAVSGFLAALGTFIALIVPVITGVYIGACLIGAGVGLFYSTNWALGTEIVPPEQAGRFLGLSNLAGAGAGAIGAYIGGPIADKAGYVLLFTIYGVLFLLSILALRGIDEEGVQEIRA